MGLGSPPLTRGPRDCSDVGHENCRITPAHAGTTRSPIVCAPCASDHPRSRGDHPSMEESLGRFERITPAHAGTTSLHSSISVPLWDHPRSRGDHEQRGIMNFASMGSPPLTRGPRIPWTRTVCPARITPAHAGTTWMSGIDRYTVTDHPRSRGDHSPEDFFSLAFSWITPAHAGTTSTRSWRRSLSRDHPRSRGDHSSVSMVM